MRRGGRGNFRGGWRGGPSMDFHHPNPRNSGFRNFRPPPPGPNFSHRFSQNFHPRSWQPFEANRNMNEDHTPRKHYFHDKEIQHQKKNYNYPGRQSHHDNHNVSYNNDAKQSPSKFKTYSRSEGTSWQNPYRILSKETSQYQAQSFLPPQKTAESHSHYQVTNQNFDQTKNLNHKNNIESDLSQISNRNYFPISESIQNSDKKFPQQNINEGFIHHRTNYNPDQILALQNDDGQSTILGYRRPQKPTRTKSFDASQHMTRSTHLSEESETFTRSVTDTVNIIKEKLMNRSTFTQSTQSNMQNEDVVDNTGDFRSNEHNQVTDTKIRRKTLRKPNVNNEANKSIKNKIVNELLQKVTYGDKGFIQKLVDNPSLSSKVDCAINSLITESQNSLKRHTRAAAEKTLYAGDGYINNDTIYEDTFIKQMQGILDPTDTVILSDLKPFVMAELNKILQVDDYEQSGILDEDEMLQMSDAYKDFYCVTEQEVEYKFNPEQETHSLAESCKSESNYDTYHSDSHENKTNLEDIKPTPRNSKRLISISDYQHEKEVMANNRRTSANISGKEENDIKQDLFNITGGTISEDDDPFADLDNQYHVAVDPSFIDLDCTKSIEENNIYNDIFVPNHLSTIKEEVCDVDNTEITVKIEKEDPIPKHDSSSSNNNSDSSKRDKHKSNKRHHEEKPEHRKEKRKKSHHHSKEKDIDSKKQSKITEHMSYSDKYVKRKEYEKSPSKTDKKKHDHDHRSKKSDNIHKTKESIHKKTEILEKKSEDISKKVGLPKTSENCPKKSEGFSKKSETTSEVKVKLEKLPIKIENDSDNLVKNSESCSDKSGNSNMSFNRGDLPETKNDDKEKRKYKNIDIFMDKPRQVQIHQAPRNTATIPNVKSLSKDVNVIKTKRPVKSLNKSTRSVSIQVEFKEKTQETQTETIALKNKFVQTNCEVTETNVAEMTSDYVHSRLKNIDSQIKELLQEKMRLSNSVESKDLNFDLGISILDVGDISPRGDMGNLSEDAIIELTNLSEEELEQMAFQGLPDPEVSLDTIEVKSGEISTADTAIESEVTTTLAKQNTSESATVKTRISKRRLGRCPSPEKLSPKKTISPIKNKRKKCKEKTPQVKKKIEKTPDSTDYNECNYNNKIKPCSVLLKSCDMEVVEKWLKMKKKAKIIAKPKTPKKNEVNKCKKNEKKKPVITEIHDSETEVALTQEVVPVSNEFQFQDFSMVISEDIEINDGGDPSQLCQSDEIVVDNSSNISDEISEEAAQNAVPNIKVYDFMGEELRSDSIKVNCSTDVVLDLKCVENNFLAACVDGNVYHIDGNGQLLNTLKVSNFAVSCSTAVKYKDRVMVYTGSLDSRIRCYDLKTGLEKGQECNVLSPIQSMDHNWETIYVGTRTGFVLQFKCQNNMLIPVCTSQFAEQAILALRAINEGPRRILLIASRSEGVTIKDASSGALLRTLGPKMTVYSLLFEEGKVFCGTSGNSVYAFEFASGSHIGDMTAGRGCVCLQAAGTLLFAGCYDGCIYVFKQGAPTPFAQLCGPSVMLISLVVTSTKILAGYNDQSLFIWKIPINILQEMVL